MQPFYPCFQEMPKSVGKNVNIDLFEEGYPQEAAEPPLYIKWQIFTGEPPIVYD